MESHLYFRVTFLWLVYKQKIQANLHNHFSLEHYYSICNANNRIRLNAEADILLSLFNYVMLLSRVKLFNFFNVSEWVVQVPQRIKCRMWPIAFTPNL